MARYRFLKKKQRKSFQINIFNQKKKKDYKDQGRSIWKASQHLERIFAFAQVYASNGTSLYHSPELQGKISLSLNFWLQNDFKNPNCKNCSFQIVN